MINISLSQVHLIGSFLRKVKIRSGSGRQQFKIGTEKQTEKKEDGVSEQPRFALLIRLLAPLPWGAGIAQWLERRTRD